MSRLSRLIAEARAELSVQEAIPAQRWEEIGKQCGSEEIAEIQSLIDSLKAELATVETWDGDTQDDINLTLYQFSNLLKLTSANA